VSIRDHRIGRVSKDSNQWRDKRNGASKLERRLRVLNALKYNQLREQVTYEQEGQDEAENEDP
jgi:hypothetical protein